MFDSRIDWNIFDDIEGEVREIRRIEWMFDDMNKTMCLDIE